MRSSPQKRNMACWEASIRFTVVSSVSSHCSMGPTAVDAQSKARMRPAISPLPKIAEGPLLRGEPGGTAVDGMAGNHNSSGIWLKGPRAIVTFYEMNPDDGAVFRFASGAGNDLCSLGKRAPSGDDGYRRGESTPRRANGRSQFGEQPVSLLPVDAAVRDTLPVHQGFAWRQRLRTSHQIALDHDPDDPAVPRGDLRRDIAAN